MILSKLPTVECTIGDRGDRAHPQPARSYIDVYQNVHFRSPLAWAAQPRRFGFARLQQFGDPKLHRLCHRRSFSDHGSEIGQTRRAAFEPTFCTHPDLDASDTGSIQNLSKFLISAVRGEKQQNHSVSRPDLLLQQ